jgi:ABC-type branched-subunit amino acid transport system ATPase component/predicted MFS family arabinose efflux permease
VADEMHDDPVGTGAPRRMPVPSEREVEEGLASYRFEPPLPPPPKERAFKLGALVEPFKQMDPRRVATSSNRLPLVLLTLGALFSRWDNIAIGLLLPEIGDHFDVDLAFLITLVTVLELTLYGVGPVIGYMADRVNRVRMLAIGAVVANCASIMTGFAPNVSLLVLSRVGGGVATAFGEAPKYSLATDWYPQDVRVRVFAYFGVAASGAGVVGVLLAGALGQTIGYQWTIGGFGLLAVVVSLPLFLLKEPRRGEIDRKSMGASDEEAAEEQTPIGWSEGWRAAYSIGTLRRLWYAAPFIAASGGILGPVMAVYYAEEFAVAPFTRSWIRVAGILVGMVGLAYSGPIADRLISIKPGRVMAFLGAVQLVSCASLVVLAFSPWLGLSVLAGLPLVFGEIVGVPLQFALASLVVPARLRGFGVQTTNIWNMLGKVLILVIINILPIASVRGVLVIVIPLNLIGAWILGSAGGGVERDIRAARAASMAEHESRRVREAGANKMIICRDVDVSYGGAQVLFNVDFDVDEGEIVALLGTNGAGKSTLLRAIAGIQEASNGAIFYDGEDITHRPPHQNAEHGIVMMPGGRAIFPSLTVAENLRVAAWMYREEEEHVARRTEEVLDLFPILRERLTQQAGTMSGGEQQMLALGQAFLMRPRLLMIDELSLGLAPAIVEQLLDIVRRINEEGTTILLVEQSANVALVIADRAVFMDKGEIRFDGPTRDLLGRGDLLRSVFLGGAGAGAAGPFIASGGGLLRKSRAQDQGQVLAVDGVHLSFGGHKALNGVSLGVGAEEVVGIIGPNGAGKTSLFDVISGYVTSDSGRVVIAGTDATTLGPDARSRLGLTRSFQNARLFPGLTVRETIAVGLEQRLGNKSTMAAALWLPVVRRSESRARRRVDNLIDLLQLEAYADKFVKELSTGTRRMVDMAFVMATEPKLLLLDEPSSGLAQSEVEMLGPSIRRMAKDTGCGVLVIEHDMPLIEALSDRLIAMELGAVLVEGRPGEVVRHPRVREAYLGASQATIERSGSSLAEALATAGILEHGPTAQDDGRANGT